MNLKKNEKKIEVIIEKKDQISTFSTKFGEEIKQFECEIDCLRFFYVPMFNELICKLNYSSYVHTPEGRIKTP